jgi:hypothetical protein
MKPNFAATLHLDNYRVRSADGIRWQVSFTRNATTDP